eukprot:g4161.t1
MADEEAVPASPEAAAPGEKVEVPDDSESVLRAEQLQAAKMEIVNRINQERSEVGLAALVFDSTISEAADEHCKEMVMNAYSSHWNLAGKKPYHRYFEAGCKDHTSENFGGYDTIEGKSFETDPDSMLKQMEQIHKTFMEDTSAAGDPKRSNVLDPLHTHVGIGVSASQSCFRYVEVYADRYVEITSPAVIEGQDVKLSGKVIERDGDWGPYACVVYYEPSPTPLTAEAAGAKEGYEDFSHSQAAVTWPWEMEFQPGSDGSFEVPIHFEELRAGKYYVHLHVRADSSGIPYEAEEEGLHVPGEGTVVATGIILSYDGEEVAADAVERPGDVGLAEDPASREIIDVRSAGADEPIPEGYETLQPFEGGSRILFRRRDEASAEQPAVTRLVFANGESSDAPSALPEGFTVAGSSLNSATAVVLDAAVLEQRRSAIDSLIEGAKASGAETDGEGQNIQSSALGNFLWESQDVRNSLESSGIDASAVRSLLESRADDFTGKDLLCEAFATAAPFIFLCVSKASEGESQGAIVDIVKGVSADGSGEVLTGSEVGYELTVLRAGDAASSSGAAATTEGQGPETLEELEALEDDGLASDEAFLARAKEEEEAKRAEQIALRDSQRSKLLDLLSEAKEEDKNVRGENAALQKRLVSYLHQAKQQAADMMMMAGDGADKKPQRKKKSELQRQYRELLQNVNDGVNTLLKEQQHYDDIALDLQAQLDEKDEKATSVRDAFAAFKREIAKSAENSRTGKPISRKLIKQFEKTELQKDEEVSKVRLRNINLRTQLKKLESQLREKEQLADGLHLIDFEQLKIENQTLNEKIEERNEELHKLRKKTTTTVQVLTHFKEKLQFEKAQNELLKRELSTLDGELTAERDVLAKAKRERESLRSEALALQGEQGFVGNSMLVQDYERRKLKTRELEGTVEMLMRKYDILKASIERNQMMSQR